MTNAESRNRARVLVVDDDDDVAHLFTLYLQAAGHEVVRASCGADALAFIQDNPVDLMLLDMNMPGMTGFEVAERVREVWPPAKLPIVGVTALGTNEDRVRGLASGCNEFITKPFAPQTLTSKVAHHLSNR